MNLKKILLNSLAILLVVCGAPLFANTSNAPSTDNNIYTENKLNITVTPQHPEFVIRLKSNPTTGFSWFLREYNNTLITPVKHSFQPPAKNLMGAPGFELWTFRVKQTGFAVPQQTALRMVYARPWQGSDSSTQLVFRVSIIANSTN